MIYHSQCVSASQQSDQNFGLVAEHTSTLVFWQKCRRPFCCAVDCLLIAEMAFWPQYRATLLLADGFQVARERALKLMMGIMLKREIVLKCMVLFCFFGGEEVQL